MVDPQQRREAWQALGKQLARWRQAAGHTQETLAPLACYTRSSIANIETGKQHADRSFWKRVDDLLGAGGVLVNGYHEAESLQWRLRRPADWSPPTSLSVPTAEMPSNLAGLHEEDAPEDCSSIDARRQRLAASNVDEARLGYLEDAVLQAIADNERLPPMVLMPRVRQLRHYIDQLLAGRQHPPQRARLYTQAAYMSGLLGALALDLNAFRSARAYGIEAVELADADLQAWARGVQSLIAYLAYARDGARRAPHSTHGIRLAVNGEARALARLGDRYGVDEAVDGAFTLLHNLPHSTGQRQPDHRPILPCAHVEVAPVFRRCPIMVHGP